MLEGLSTPALIATTLYLTNSLYALWRGQQLALYKIYALVWLCNGAIGATFVCAMLFFQFNFSLIYWLYITGGTFFLTISIYFARAFWLASLQKNGQPQ